jgi:NAD-dependent dihydropyrimidine dehydrogenase PreA subunit
MAAHTRQNDAATITVDHARCKGHGVCADNCPGQVYDVVDGYAVAARIGDCVECCTCVEVCPENAILHSSCM